MLEIHSEWCAVWSCEFDPGGGACLAKSVNGAGEANAVDKVIMARVDIAIWRSSQAAFGGKLDERIMELEGGHIGLPPAITLMSSPTMPIVTLSKLKPISLDK